MSNNYETISYEVDECLSKGICSVNPTLTSIQEIILLYMRELSFYLLKLKDFEATNKNIQADMTEFFFNIVTNVEYNQEQFNNIIAKLYNYINQSKVLYEKICEEKNIHIEVNKLYFKYSKKFDLTDAIRKGEKYLLKKTQKFIPKQKEVYEIMLFLCKSLTIKITELNRLGKDNEEAYYMILSLLNLMKPGAFVEAEIKDTMWEAIDSYYEIVNDVNKAHVEIYGKPSLTEVSFSTEQGKAILVSGSDFKKLESVLEAVKDLDINVYTHGMEMLIAHSFPKFRAYTNLKGHFGAGLDSSLIDFATFPGSILMTQGTLQKVEYLYRGKLFTLDPIAPSGTIKIKEGDYSHLIKATLEAKGFVSAQHKPPINVGYSEEQMSKVVSDVVAKLNTGEIKQIYIIGILNYLMPHNKYFEDFFELLPKDSFAFSLSYKIHEENTFHLYSFYDYSLIYKILNDLKAKIDLSKTNISVFLTKCDKYTISNLLYLKRIGIKNIYTSKCSPTLINPSVMATLQEMFDIKEMSDPKKDIAHTLIT